MDFGDSKIQDFGATATGDEKVCGLDVAMEDARGVSGVQAVEDFHGHAQQGLRVESATSDAFLQRGSVQKLHGEEGAAILLADVVHGADVLVIQGGCGARLAPESRQRVGVCGELGRQELSATGRWRRVSSAL